MKRIAIVGCGGMGGGHAIAISSGTGNAVYHGETSKDKGTKIFDTSFNSDIKSKLELAGIYDIDPSRVEWAKERGYGIYNSYEEILADPSVDIVLVATPNHIHKELSISAMKAGKHVLCEKPVMMNSRELEEVLKVSKETGMVFYPRQNRRWDRDFRIIKKIYDEKLIGKTFRIENRIHGSRGIPSDWRKEEQYGGGMMLDWGVHILDRLLSMVSEKITAVNCKLSYVLNEEVDDGFTMLITFESGLTALFEVGTCNFISLPLWYICGDYGSAVIDDWHCTGKMVKLSSWEDKDALPILAGAGLTKTMAPRDEATLITEELPDVCYDDNELYTNLVNVIENGEEQIVTGEHALKVLKVMEAAIMSSKENRTIVF